MDSKRSARELNTQASSTQISTEYGTTDSSRPNKEAIDYLAVLENTTKIVEKSGMLIVKMRT